MMYLLIFIGVASVVLLCLVYFVIGCFLSYDHPEPIDMILIWPIMLYRERVRNYGKRNS